ncbi:MAG: DUF3084 domain-containing protein [Cyanobacteria bacterium RU_5_0]|nr:DUF3084 domain-containing protein [Cyanobacteria bacterium RU_5_0]
MTTGLVLIAAVLVLGGVIATVGDRLGMRVGKARLSLFNLRPRQTATLITILTGGVISASTLAILFAASDQLRTGVFELGKIQRELGEAREELNQTTTEKEQIEDELEDSREEQFAAERQLKQINQSLQDAIERQDQTQDELSNTQALLQQIQARYLQAQTLLSNVSQQANSLQTEIQQLQGDRQELIRQRDQVREQIAQRDEEIARRDQAILERETQLRQLENQYVYLAQQVQDLEREYQALRVGNVALLRNQPLASGVFRIVTADGATQVIEELLLQANLVALQRVQPSVENSDEQVIQITNAEVDQAIGQLEEGKDYVIRVQAAGNYVVGEPCVLAGEACIQVFVAIAPNQLVFQQGDVVASTRVDASIMPDQELAERILLLIAAAQFRARQAGVLADSIQISDNRRETAIEFIQKLKQLNQPIEIQAIAAEDAYTAGVRIELIAVQNGQTLFSTQQGWSDEGDEGEQGDEGDEGDEGDGVME